MIVRPPKTIWYLMLAVTILGLVLAGCGKKATAPPPTAARPTNTPTREPTATSTQPPPTLRPMPTDTPTPQPTGIVCSPLDLQAALATLSFGPLEFTAGGEVGGLSRTVGQSPDGDLTVVMISAGERVESLEVRMAAPENEPNPDILAAAVLAPVLDAALPMWEDRAAWLSMALAAQEPEASIKPPSCGNVTVSLVRPERNPLDAWLLLSALPGDQPEQDGAFAFDPTLGIGIDRQTVQWAFEALDDDAGWVFRRATDRRGQPAVVGSASNSRATLTLVGPQDELVLSVLGMVILENDPDGTANANAYARALIRAIAPDWAEGPAWVEDSILAALDGASADIYVNGLRVRVLPDPKTPRLVQLAVAVRDRTLPTPAPTAEPLLTRLRVSGLPDAELSCLTAAFFLEGAELTRLPLDESGNAVGPMADEVLLIGDESGACPWSRYWTPASRMRVPEDGVVEIVFAPIAP